MSHVITRLKFVKVGGFYKTTEEGAATQIKSAATHVDTDVLADVADIGPCTMCKYYKCEDTEHSAMPETAMPTETVCPSYYEVTIDDYTFDCDQVIHALGMDFHTGNAFKYLWRAGKKPGEPREKDLDRARHYINKMLK